jgi:hypothetical protein
MTKMISMCGLDCSVCPAHIAFLTNDQSLREKTAEEWSKAFKAELTAEMINCVGCTTVEGVHIGHCGQCEMRQCGLGRKVANCALCADFPCALIAGFMANVAPAKANLEEIRASRGK